MSALTRLLAASIAGTLMLAVPAHAADPEPIAGATASASCALQTDFTLAPPTQPSSRSRHLVRANVASGSLLVYGDSAVVYGKVGDVMWTDGDGHSPFASWGNPGYCPVASSLSGTFYDVPDAPTSFSGRSTYSTNGGINSSPRAVAPGGARYFADVSVSQGSVEVSKDDYGSGSQIVGSAGRVELGYKAADALLGVVIRAQDGPPAQWTVALSPYPLAVAEINASPTAIAPASAVSFQYKLTNDATVDALIVNAAGEPVRSLASAFAVAGDSTRTLTWDGLDATGGRVPDGVYRLAINGRDAFGSTAHAEATVTVDGTGPGITSVSPATLTRQSAITVALIDPSGIEQASATQSQASYAYASSQTVSATEKRLTLAAPSAGWKPGTIYVDVTGSDALGNGGTKRLAFSVPAPPPASSPVAGAPTTRPRFRACGPVRRGSRRVTVAAKGLSCSKARAQVYPRLNGRPIRSIGSLRCTTRRTSVAKTTICRKGVRVIRITRRR